MTYQASLSESNTLSLSQVVARLAENDRVDGVLTIGTTSGEGLTPASDYDIVIVLPEMPDGLEPYGVTHIAGRFTDLLFVTGQQLDEILALSAPIDSHAWLGRIIRWFENGRIAFDRYGQLHAVRHKVQAASYLLPLADDGRAGWWRVNYNLAQTRRMLTANDPVYRVAAELRIALYGPTDLLFNYFDIRNLPWTGDKDAVRYLLSNDPDYLAGFRQFIAEADPERRFALYEDLAKRTIAPVGELWGASVTALAFHHTGAADHPTDQAERFWDRLIAVKDQDTQGDTPAATGQSQH
jgi:hypothetical protein